MAAVVWPVGALLLVQQRRWRVLGFRGGFAVAALAVFLHGFTLNPAHASTDFSPAGSGGSLQFWLASPAVRLPSAIGTHARAWLALRRAPVGSVPAAPSAPSPRSWRLALFTVVRSR